MRCWSLRDCNFNIDRTCRRSRVRHLNPRGSRGCAMRSPRDRKSGAGAAGAVRWARRRRPASSLPSTASPPSPTPAGTAGTRAVPTRPTDPLTRPFLHISFVPGIDRSGTGARARRGRGGAGRRARARRGSSPTATPLPFVPKGAVGRAYVEAAEGLQPALQLRYPLVPLFPHIPFRFRMRNVMGKRDEETVRRRRR